MNEPVPTATVVVCAYTMRRWVDLTAALASLRDQSRPPDQILLVVDHAPDLFDRARQLNGVEVVCNRGPKGLSGARNTGIAVARGTVVAFLDDDATAEPDWLVHLLEPFSDPSVLGVGGWADPRWDRGRPSWFPPEFDWVVGCSHEGLPRHRGDIRNPIGCTMAIRRDVFDAVGGFAAGLGRVDGVPLGCEETELCIRAAQRMGGRFVLEPSARVHHRVPAVRSTPRYFLARCWSEGRSKAAVAQSVGLGDALTVEVDHVLGPLRRGLTSAVRGVVRGRPGAAARGLAVAVGLVFAVAGFVWQRGRARGGRSVGERPQVSVRAVELAGAIPDLPGGSSPRQLRCLARHDGKPLAYVDVTVPPEGMRGDELCRQLWSAVAPPMAVGPRPVDGLPSLGWPRRLGEADTDRSTMVVVATRDRPVQLEECLRSLLRQTAPAAEIVVVDSTPSSDAAERLVRERFAGSPVRYERSDRPGLAVAHNLVLDDITTELVAFTDDDVVVDEGWLAALAAPFDDPCVACTTGLIAPRELRTTPQHWLEERFGFGKGFVRRRFDLNGHRPADPLFPLTAGTMGSGANMAFRTEVLRGLGGFDPVLGAGSRARGGDDLAAFFDVIVAGHQVVYEPAAIVFHQHHDTYAAARRTAFGYGVGLGAFLTKALVTEPRLAATLVRFAGRAVPHAIRPSEGRSVPDYPRSFVLLNGLGLLTGPLHYARGRFEHRRMPTRRESHAP